MWLFAKEWVPLNILGVFSPLGFHHADTAQGVFFFHHRLSGKAISFLNSKGPKVSCFEMGSEEIMDKLKDEKGVAHLLVSQP